MKKFLPLLLAVLPAALQALEVPRSGERPPPSHPFGSKAPAPEVLPTPPPQTTKSPRSFQENPSGAGLEVMGLENSLDAFTVLSFVFPTPMSHAVDAKAEESPVVFEPPLDVEFVWRSPTTGELRVTGPVIPDTKYLLRLREGLKDLEGAALDTGAWGAVMNSPPLQLEWTSATVSDRLPALPQVHLALNYPVDLASAAGAIVFRDRNTRHAIPAEVYLNRADGPVAESREARDPGAMRAQSFRVRPALPLPAPARIDLVVDGLRDAYGGKSLPHPLVLPLGQTRLPAIETVAATAHPLEPRKIVVTFDEPLAEGPLPEGAVAVEPSVKGLKTRVEGRNIVVEGAFDAPARYVVTVSREVKGASGFTLEKDGRWGATFRAPRPAIIFPDREIRMRGVGGLRFSFYQVACGPGRWVVAKIPPALLPEVRRRLREFEREVRDASGRRVWTGDGYFAQAPTAPLAGIPSLEPLASGEFPAASGEELREIEWNGKGIKGPVLVEVTASCADGRTAGNRAILYPGDLAVTRKESRGSDVLRVLSLQTGEPQPGARLRLLDARGAELAAATTDREGIASFSPALFAGCEYFEVSAAGAVFALQPRDLAAVFPGGMAAFGSVPRLRGFTWTDRPLYRPGQPVRFKGFVRAMDPADGLRVPGRLALRWTLGDFAGVNPLASGNATVDREGGWSGEWEIPGDAASGEFWLRVWSGDEAVFGQPVLVRIEEFRNPPFSVECRTPPPPSPGVAELEVASALFHGAPNRGARVRWRALWCDISRQTAWEEEHGPVWRVDTFSQEAKEPQWSAEAAGELVLDEEGRARIRCASPFPDSQNRAWSLVEWRVDITGAEGQTVSGGARQQVPMQPVLYGVRQVDAREGRLVFAWDALEPFVRKANPKAELYRVETRTVKERLAPGVYRFQNSDVFHPAGSLALSTPGKFEFQVADPGKYVAVLSPPAGEPGQPVSVDAWLPGPGEAPLPVESEAGLEIVPAGANAEGRRTWLVGETAAFDIRAPTAGIAWVSVESDRILRSFTIPLEGNLARLELPILPEYEPNAFLTVYLLRPGGPTGLAGEMFGWTRLDVERPGRRLEVRVEPAQKSVQPREEISGRVLVKAAGRPVAGADLTLYAVDDSVLQAGGWRLPSGFLETFLPARGHGVRTFSALEGLVDGIQKSWLMSKGYIVGDGGELLPGSVVFERQNFQPVLFWRTGLKTDASGAAAFSATAADDLTRYRVIAVAQTRESQFGAGDALVEVSKPLLIETALPRFLRAGDEAFLRAVVRQREDSDTRAEINMAVEGEAKGATGPSSLELKGRAPGIIAFPVRAGERQGKFTARFAARTPAASDAVAVTLPVVPATVEITETLSGNWTGRFTGPELPPHWSHNAAGTALSVSTTPWLPYLQGIPMVVEYPHGCFEQKSAKVLVLATLDNLAEFLPDPGISKSVAVEVAARTLQEFDRSLLPDGFLPYWPGSNERCLFTTIQCAWSAQAAERRGIPVPPRLAETLPATLLAIANGATPGAIPDLRAMAVFVLSKSPTATAWREAADELHRLRDKLGADGRLFLALAMDGLEERAAARNTLLENLPAPDEEFNPRTFSSPARTEALRMLAEISSGSNPPDEILRGWLAKASSLSTQENLWWLIAAGELLTRERPVALPASGLSPQPDMRSANGSAALWLKSTSPGELPRLRKEGSWLLRARVRLPFDAPPASEGLRLERALANLTEPARDGSPGKPFAIGDEIAISYRMFSDRQRSFVALEEPLPAAMEAIHPARRQPPAAADTPPPAGLSHAELYDDRVCMFFNTLPSGLSSASLVVRVTSQGSFTWPQATLTPMYDSRARARTTATRLTTTQ